MILLEKLHPSIQAAVDRILSGANEIPHTIVRDFDGCSYHISVEWEESTNNETEGDNDCNVLRCEGRRASVIVALCHSTPFSELNAHNNFEEFLPALFPPDLRGFVRAGARCHSGGNGGGGGAFVAEIRLPATVAAELRMRALCTAAQLRILSYVPLFSRQCELFIARPEVELPPLLLRYHDGEEMAVFSHKGGFVVSIALRPASADEAVFMRHFLQAMMDVRKLQRELSGAPAFLYDNGKLPVFIPSSVPLLYRDDKDVFWCSFQLFRHHMEPVERLVETVTQLVNFRNTVAYHIHAGRMYMHGMMRKRVETSLKVLNRAKTKTTGKAKITIQ